MDDRFVSRLQQVTVLGATGSVGLSALDVIARHPDRYQVFALTGFTRLTELLALCVRHAPRYAVMPEPIAARGLQDDLRAAGLGVCMRDGRDDAKASADEVSELGNDDDAVARRCGALLAAGASSRDALPRASGAPRVQPAPRRSRRQILDAMAAPETMRTQHLGSLA